jgi:formiminotetrahydrofolate cyclodeaminase
MKLFFASAIVSMSSIAFANGAAEFPNCKKEIADNKCSGDAKAIEECLTKHESSLSEKCKKDHAAYAAKHGAKK